MEASGVTRGAPLAQSNPTGGHNQQSRDNPALTTREALALDLRSSQPVDKKEKCATRIIFLYGTKSTLVF